MILEESSHTKAAQALSMELQFLRDWVLRYNAGGFKGRIGRLRGGSDALLKGAQFAEVGAWIEAGFALEQDGERAGGFGTSCGRSRRPSGSSILSAAAVRCSREQDFDVSQGSWSMQNSTRIHRRSPWRTSRQR